MALFTHGTTLEGLKAILAGKGKEGLPNPWTVCDNDGQMYFYSVAKHLDDYDFDADATLSGCQRSSMENARLQAAFTGKPTDVYVLTCEIDEESLEDDYSCDGMGDSASQMACADFDPACIVAVHKLDGLSIWQYPAVLACVGGNSLFNWGELDPSLLKLVESVSGGYDELYDQELIEVEKESIFSL